LGPANICVGPGGPDAEATAILGALLDLADQLPHTEAFRQRLRARNTDRRDREGWVWAGLEMENHEACAKVAEDLRPFDLPYTADILAARSYGDTVGGPAHALLGYFVAIRGRHFVATQLNRGLQLGMAGRRSGDTIKFWGQARYTTKTMRMMCMRPRPTQSVH